MSTELPNFRKLNVQPETDEELRARFNANPNTDDTDQDRNNADGDANGNYEEQLTQEQQGKLSRAQMMRRLGAIAGISLGPVALIMGANMLNHQAEKDPAANPEATNAGSLTPGAVETTAPTAEATPSTYSSPANTAPLETAKPTASATSPEVNKSRHSVAELKAMSVADFNKLPHEDRMVFVSRLLQDASEEYLAYSKDSYEYNPLEVASLQNTPEQIIKQLQFVSELPFHQGVTDTAADQRLDKDTAKKALSAMFYETSGDTSAFFMVANAAIENSQGKNRFGDHYTNVEEIAPVQTAVDQQGKTIKYRTFNFTDKDGKVRFLKATYAPLTETKGIWQAFVLN